ncbi:MAG: ankyrin repeat domain-containing protein [Puniceicoccales bacterium]|jgi:hypothetical protein|nr:ankyrin repeat domain-containing protein [Puniceicoccales bacterium]
MKDEYVRSRLSVIIFLLLGLYAISPHSCAVSLLPPTDPVQGTWNFFSKTQKRCLNEFIVLEEGAVRLRLEKAIRNHDLGEVQKLLILNFVYPKVVDGRGLLHLAILKNDPLTLAAILAAYFYDQFGQKCSLCNVDDVVNELTPIMMAVRNGQVEMVSLLMYHGAKIEGVGADGTVLHTAIRNNDCKMIFEILFWINKFSSDEKKKFLNKVDAEGKTIFHTICEQFLSGEFNLVVFNEILLQAEYFDAMQYDNEEWEHIAHVVNRSNEYLEENIDLILEKLRDDSWWKWICRQSKAILRQIWAFIRRSRAHTDIGRVIKGKIIRNLCLLKQKLNMPIIPMGRAQQPDVPRYMHVAPGQFQFFVSPPVSVPRTNVAFAPQRQ